MYSICMIRYTYLVAVYESLRPPNIFNNDSLNYNQKANFKGI